MLVESNKILPEVKEITIDRYEDYRGQNFEVYNKEYYKAVYDGTWHTDTISRSRYGVLRGMHGDDKTHKLIQCLYGSVFMAIVDFRKDSPNYLKHTIITLSDTNRKQVYIPAGFLNGHVCMTTECVFSYKLSEPYNSDQYTIHYLDSDLNIQWPLVDVIVSERDFNGDFISI